MYRAFSYRRLRYFLAFAIGAFALLGAAAAVEGDTAGAVDGLRTAAQFAMLAAAAELLAPPLFEWLRNWARRRSQPKGWNPDRPDDWEDWWACPECDGDTQVIQTKDGAQVRECTECDWSFEVARLRGDSSV